MTYIPKVGDKVKLSRYGYKCLHLRSAEDYERSQNMTITRAHLVTNDGSNIYTIEVDVPTINKLLLNSRMVEPCDSSTTG